MEQRNKLNWVRIQADQGSPDACHPRPGSLRQRAAWGQRAAAGAGRQDDSSVWDKSLEPVRVSARCSGCPPQAQARQELTGSEDFMSTLPPKPTLEFRWHCEVFTIGAPSRCQGLWVLPDQVYR